MDVRIGGNAEGGFAADARDHGEFTTEDHGADGNAATEGDECLQDTRRRAGATGSHGPAMEAPDLLVKLQPCLLLFSPGIADAERGIHAGQPSTPVFGADLLIGEGGVHAARIEMFRDHADGEADGKLMVEPKIPHHDEERRVPLVGLPRDPGAFAEVSPCLFGAGDAAARGGNPDGAFRARLGLEGWLERKGLDHGYLVDGVDGVSCLWGWLPPQDLDLSRAQPFPSRSDPRHTAPSLFPSAGRYAANQPPCGFARMTT